MKIKRINRREFDGEVFNIATPPHKNYFANGMLVHNCYQASTTEGVHAPLAEIERIVAMLKEMKVFEVALGGGEPTAHPQFETILRMFHDAGIVPNFTTYSNKWLADEALLETVRQTVGGIGVSCMSSKDLRLIDEIAAAMKGNQRYFFGGPQLTAQHVLGSVPLYVTGDLIRDAFESRKGVLLLGYKNVGFGPNHERHDTRGTEVFLKLAAWAESNQWAKLSVDTALVDQYPQLTEALGCPKALVTSPEGKFSCYIDAVAGLMAPSSYVEKSIMTTLPADTEGFKTVYAAY